MNSGTAEVLKKFVPSQDINNFYDAIFKSMPEAEAEPWEIEAIEEGRRDFEENGGIRDEDVDWD